MNEVVSPTYTLTVYRTAAVHVMEEPLHRIIERLLSLAKLNPKGGYEFKVYRLFSKHTELTLEFEHTRKDSVYRYPCRIGNVAGLNGIFEAVLKIPQNEGFHSGINDELNRAATKLLTELANTPAEATSNAPPPKAMPNPSAPPAVQEPELPPATPPPSTAPAPAASEAVLPQTEVRPLARTKSRPKRIVGKPTPKAAKRGNAPSITAQLRTLKRLVAEELRKKQSELAELTELQRRIEQLKARIDRRATALTLLKKLS